MLGCWLMGEGPPPQHCPRTCGETGKEVKSQTRQSWTLVFGAQPWRFCHWAPALPPQGPPGRLSQLPRLPPPTWSCLMGQRSPPRRQHRGHCAPARMDAPAQQPSFLPLTRGSLLLR